MAADPYSGTLRIQRPGSNKDWHTEDRRCTSEPMDAEARRLDLAAHVIGIVGCRVLWKMWEQVGLGIQLAEVLLLQLQQQQNSHLRGVQQRRL